MKFLSLIIIFLGFLKSFYYGIFEIKEKNNKFGGIVTCFIAILRTYYSLYCFNYI